MELSIGRTTGGRWQQFMDAAAARVQHMARLDDASEGAECAWKILETAASWTLWERELGAALRPVASCRTRMQQVRALRQASFGWVHRAAPFRHLRNENVRGERRQRLVSVLHGQFAHYPQAVVAEHGRYQRSVCHGFCADHLGEVLLEDPLHAESIRRYQSLYMEYFRTFEQVNCGVVDAPESELHKLLPMMKYQLAEMRHAILEYPQRKVWLHMQGVMRSPNGDTQRLRPLDFNLN
jgi:hypothetical protein